MRIFVWCGAAIDTPMAISGAFHVCGVDSSVISVDSLEQRCHHLFYGEFTR